MPDEQNITHSYIIDFVRENLKKSEGILYELEDFAHKNEVPIVQKEVSAFLEVICRIHKPVKVLEVGCAIGYSAILMAKNLPQNAHVTTIERDEKMAELARQNFIKTGEIDKCVPEDIAASFQQSVVEVLVSKTIKAAKAHGVKKIALAGGVASNSALRTRMQEACERNGFYLSVPAPILCTDNAAMIGCAAYYEYIAGVRDGLDLNANPSLKLGQR